MGNFRRLPNDGQERNGNLPYSKQRVNKMPPSNRFTHEIIFQSRVPASLQSYAFEYQSILRYSGCWWTPETSM